MNLVKFSVEFSCETGKLDDERRTGPIYRVSLDECKKKFVSVGKAFEYYEGSNHCQEVLYNTDDITNSNSEWQTCKAISKKPAELLGKFQNI